MDKGTGSTDGSLARAFAEVKRPMELGHGRRSPAGAPRLSSFTCPSDTDRQFSANFDRQASATNSVLFLGLSPPKANKTVSFFVSFHRGATQSGILFLVSIEQGGSRRVYDRGALLSDVSQLGNAPCRCLARPGGSARRCRRTEARNAAVGSESRLGSFGADSCIQRWCGIITG